MNKSIDPRAWRILIVAAGINVASGMLYIWSILSKELMIQYHWNSKEASLPYTVATITLVVAMIFFGKLQDKIGPRLPATLSGIFIGVGMVLSSTTKSPGVLVLTFGVVVGIGLGIANICTTPPAVKWFPAKIKGFATGVVVAGIALSSVIYSPLLNYLLEMVGIVRTFIIVGVLGLCSITLLAQFLINPPDGFSPEDSTTNSRPGNQHKDVELTWQEMFRSVDFYKLWVMMAFSSSAGLMIFGHAANIARVQVHWEGGYLLVVLTAVFSAAGRFFGGGISDRIGRINLMRIMFSLQAVNMLLFSQFNSLPLLIVGMAVGGFCYGANFSVFPAAVLDRYGSKNFGLNYGIFFSGWGVSGIIGPMIAAAFLDATGSFSGAYYLASALLAVGVLLAFSIQSAKPDPNAS